MARWPKPAEGSWTEHYPELGTGAGVVRGLDLARVLRARARGDLRAGLAQRRAGRAAAPRPAATSPRSSQVARTSIIVVRGRDGEVRAFHNICRHRGNKLVWNDDPGDEETGTCRQFTCKYHGWRYDLDGALNFVQQEGEFFDLDKDDFGLVPVHCDVWAGFIFVNLAREPEQSLQEFLGPMITTLEGYPFDQMTSDSAYRTDDRRRTGSCSWTPSRSSTTHPSCTRSSRRRSLANAAQRGRLRGAALPHRRSAPAGEHRPASASGRWTRSMVKPMESITRSGLFGPWDEPDLGRDARRA